MLRVEISIEICRFTLENRTGFVALLTMIYRDFVAESDVM